jgi:hypothetical protein
MKGSDAVAAFASMLIMTAAVFPVRARADRREPEVSVRMMPRVAQAPATVQLLVHVPPQPENRRLRVTIDSIGYYRSSDLQLDGDRAAMVHSVRWLGVPSGEYDVVVQLIRSDGKHRVVNGGRLAVVGLGF